MCPLCYSWPPISYLDHWTCDICSEAMDEWWLVDHLCWYSDNEDDEDDKRDDQEQYIDFLQSKLDPEQISVDDCILCDEDILRNHCNCDPFPFDWFDLTAKMRMSDISPSNIYHTDPENSLDCFLCEYFNSPQCVPLRNWYRFYHTYDEFPKEKIHFCKYFYPDSVVPEETTEVIFSMLEKKNILTKVR